MYKIQGYYDGNRITGISHSRLARYEILYRFINETVLKGREEEKRELYRDLLMYDLYLRENAKSRPSFAREQAPFKEAVKQFFIKEAKMPSLLAGYEDYDSRQISKMAHAEGMRDQSVIPVSYTHLACVGEGSNELDTDAGFLAALYGRQSAKRAEWK